MVDESWQIAGIIASFLGLFVAIFLTVYVRQLDNKQRERDESFYRIMTIKDIQQLNEHLINIYDIVESDRDVIEKDQQIEITQQLNRYAKRNARLIEILVTNKKCTMGKWLSLEKTEKEDINHLIETTNWVLDEYLPKTDETIETQQRRWLNYSNEFEKRKSDASRKVHSLITKYN